MCSRVQTSMSGIVTGLGRQIAIASSKEQVNESSKELIVNEDLRQLVNDKLRSDGLQQENWSNLVVAACDGHEAIENLRLSGKTTAKPSARADVTNHAAAYLTSMTVQGFRGIGPKQTLTFN